jgi:exopolysaccharide biosynthesis WecB/TagA/CpsF family protein
MAHSKPTLFGIQLPQTSKKIIKSRISRLTRNLSQKHVLYFLYSEFLLRANRNPYYKDTLNRANMNAIDGKGLHWAMWATMHTGFLPSLYSTSIIRFPTFLRIPLFVLLFGIQLAINLLTGFVTLILRISYTSRTHNEVVLGRDFVYDLLGIAEKKGFKTLILGGSSESDQITRSLIQQFFPKLDIISWSRSSTSLLMRDQVLPELSSEILNSTNVCQFFPDLADAKHYIQEEKPDLILVCLGGASGRQEFFIDNLYQDPSVDFLLATGLGAAIDHLGGGKKQTIAPRWMIQLGLEWLHRFIHQPYRRKRILDSILTLWWWTTVEQFMQHAHARPTVVNIVTNTEKQVLLVKRRNILPGDIGWTFVQGGIERGELAEAAGIREIEEEVRLEKKHLKTYLPATFSDIETYSISFVRFMLMGAKYNSSKNTINFVEYTGTKNPRANWENADAKWFDQREVLSKLSIEKQKDWINAVQLVKRRG